MRDFFVKQRTPLQVGLAAGVGAYVLWGVFPLYVNLLNPAQPVEIIAHRVVWSAVLCLGIIALARGWRALGKVWARPRTLLLLGVASVLIATNWLVYIYGVQIGRVVDASLGYYINPLFTVLLGVVVLRERLRPVQWVAVGVGALAVVVIAVGYGQLPWISLVLAGSFGLYGLLKNRVGRSVDALTGLATETLLLTPLAVGYLVFLGATSSLTFTQLGFWHALALFGTGAATAVPLLLFNASARRIPLSLMGLLQYIGPTLQLIIAVFVLGEEMPLSRWAGFGLVWLALVIITVDGVRRRGAARAAQRALAAAPLGGPVGGPA